MFLPLRLIWKSCFISYFIIIASRVKHWLQLKHMNKLSLRIFINGINGCLNPSLILISISINRELIKWQSKSYQNIFFELLQYTLILNTPLINSYNLSNYYIVTEFVNLKRLNLKQRWFLCNFSILYIGKAIAMKFST